jgi:hypothetical protein
MPCDVQQAPIDERLEAIDVCVADVFRRCQGEVPCEDGKPREQISSGPIEQVAAPGDGRA